MEEQIKTKDLTAKLEDVPLGRMYYASYKALIRLQIYFIGRTHEMMLEFRDKAQSALMRHGGKDQALDGASGFAVQSDLLRMWGNTWTEWQAEFQQMRREAGSIPFGVLAVSHERLVRPAAKAALNEAIGNQDIFGPQLRILLDAAAEHLYGDSMNLSGRIWRIDRETRSGINLILMNGIQNGDSAWNIAKQLEQFLGAGEDCPRWTKNRLYGKTSTEKVTSTSGLLAGNDCDSSGVSYNAIRLARTEIQKIHALATDKVMSAQPWVEKEQGHLSPAHPERDECDDVVEGGERGEGIYELGTIEYPLHPNCFCFKTAVLMDEKAFTSSLNGWLKGESWPEMDSYSDMIGGDENISLNTEAVSLAVWLFGDNLQERLG